MLSLAILVSGRPAVALEEKGGYQVTVGKVTLSRNDARYGYYYSSRRINRLQGLKVTVKNATFKPQPEGEIEWSILTMKYYGGIPEVVSGKEKLPALKAAETTDLVLGSAQIFGWLDSMERTKDKLEWQVVIKRDGAEVLRTASKPNFDALAKGARKLKNEAPSEDGAPDAPARVR